MTIQTDDLLSVEETARILKSTPKSMYLYLCNSGKNGGVKRKRFPTDLYIRMGRKVLFIKPRLMKWLTSGAQFV
ncbi:MAG: hypothetical protein V2B14_04420 [bacterium]